MKEITKYWKQTCIDFGKYVQQQWARYEDADMLWLEFQEQMAKDVNTILDACDNPPRPNDMFKIVEQLQSQVKALHTMVSANNIALNNVEKDLYEDEKFLFNEKSYEESNKETLPQIKCYCGHTTMCDCEPLNRIEKAREPETKQ